jgi:hypothetical protein
LPPSSEGGGSEEPRVEVSGELYGEEPPPCVIDIGTGCSFRLTASLVPQRMFMYALPAGALYKTVKVMLTSVPFACAVP